MLLADYIETLPYDQRPVVIRARRDGERNVIRLQRFLGERIDLPDAASWSALQQELGGLSDAAWDRVRREGRGALTSLPNTAPVEAPPDRVPVSPASPPE